MSIDRPFQGGLFAGDFLGESIAESDDWQSFDDKRLDGLEAALREVFGRFPTARSPNESQTEDDLIWPVLREIGWAASLRQQNLSVHGHQNVPDGLLFADEAAKDRANGFVHEWRRYEFGLAIVESKLKFDRQIVAIARTQGQNTIYSDDGDIAKLGEALELEVVPIHALPVGADEPQGELDL